MLWVAVVAEVNDLHIWQTGTVSPQSFR
jgi:hypothetical protein